MNTLPKSNRRNSGFTLVEMIGVLAVIAILASLLVPRVFQAIGDAKINNAASTVNSVKSAVSEYYGKYGKIAGPAGAALTFSSGVAEGWDVLALLPEGFVEKPFSVRIGNGKVYIPAVDESAPGAGDGVAATEGSRLRVIDLVAKATTSTTAPGTVASGAYDLDGTSPVNDISGAKVIEGVIVGVDPQDAKDFNDRIDGTTLGAALGSADAKGRVKYGAAESDGTVIVYVYIAHK